MGRKGKAVSGQATTMPNGNAVWEIKIKNKREQGSKPDLKVWQVAGRKKGWKFGEGGIGSHARSGVWFAYLFFFLFPF